MIPSQLEVLAQGNDYLASVSEFEYNEVIKPNFISSAGAHMRHILDHYQAIMDGLNVLTIDYDKRVRGCDIETNPKSAAEKIKQIGEWLEQLTTEQLTQEVMLSTEISISNQQIAKVKTTVARELVFAASHSVHHYAMIAQISLAQNKTLPEFFGIAPATATYLRSQQQIH
jgi:uncharacterized damage-inducible protein DinB